MKEFLAQFKVSGIESPAILPRTSAYTDKDCGGVCGECGGGGECGDGGC